MSSLADNPYPGPRAFRQADQARFYGRDADVAAVVNLWTTSRLTTLIGPVGAGKTSLLQAGVCPSMPVTRSRLLPVGNLFGDMTFPFPALADHNPLTLALLRSWSPEDVPTRLAGLTVSDFVRGLARGTDGVTYAAVDQLDDFIASPRHQAQAAWRHQFLTELTRAIEDHPRLHLLLVARSETAGLLASAIGVGARHEIAGLTRQGAVEAVVRPAAGAGRSFTEAAARRLIGDLRAADDASGSDGDQSVGACVEPSLLQAVCQQLWDALPPGVTDISCRTIREFGDADTALATRYGKVISEAAALHDIPFTRLRASLVDTFVISSATRARAYEGAQATAGLPNAVLRGLVDRHLLTSETSESVRCYRLLSRRLVEPLVRAPAERAAAPTPAEHLLAAERELARGELDDAWTHGERALRAAAGLRERAEAESLLGNVRHRRGQLSEALSHYRLASELRQATGDTAAAAYELAAVGQVLLAEGALADALPELRAAVARAPSDLGLQTQLGLALWQLGDGHGAVAILNWVLTIDGEHVEARRARGEVLADLGEAPSALLDLSRGTPGRPSTRAARALALARLGDAAAAAREVSGALAGARRNGPALLFAARALDLIGDGVSARERAREAIDATDPPLSPAHRRLARQLAGQRRGAAQPSPLRA